jgi:ring-1,2-phenylacetyl-CoA epoxidase subunit PaaD
VVDRLDRARAAAESVVDPEIPVLTIADLGVLRDVRLDGDAVEVTITPTYTGCPAMTVIAWEIEAALSRAGFAQTRVRTVLSPAWTTDFLSADGRRKLREYGIAPPDPSAHPACPRCGSRDTEVISAFGSTACKALHRCLNCREPFDSFKCH